MWVASDDVNKTTHTYFVSTTMTSNIDRYRWHRKECNLIIKRAR